MNRKWTSESHQILEVAGELKRYNRWIVSLFAQYFGNNTLEIGSGMGALSTLIPSKKLIVSDLRDDYFSYLKKEFNFETLKLDIEKEAPKKYAAFFDTIFSSNVFEHIKKDWAAFDNSFKLLKPKGKLLLFVPASPRIYGKLDESMGHYRRYTLTEVTEKAEQAGFKIVKVSYANLPGYFTWWGRGILLPKIIPNQIQDQGDGLLGKIFDLIVTPLLYLEKIFTLPFGQSVMLVAQKP